MRIMGGLLASAYLRTVSLWMPNSPVTTNLPFDEWTEVFGSERLTGALLDRLTHRVHILEMNGESYRLRQSRQAVTTRSASGSPDP